MKVTVACRSGRYPEIPVDWFATDTVYDVVERAGFDPRQVFGVTIGSHYIRGLRTEPVWPNSIIEVNCI